MSKREGPPADPPAKRQRAAAAAVSLAHRDTLHCVARRCVPCAYKVLVDVGPHCVANQRPEMCLRLRGGGDAEAGAAAGAGPEPPAAGGLGWLAERPERRILTVGDGNFSFSLALARAGAAGRLVATSHESRETILATYPDGEAILAELAALGVRVEHGVDATALPAGLGEPFDVVLWNFPCVRAPEGADGQNAEMEVNKDLLRRFFAAVPAHLVSGGSGEVHVTHKTKPPFSQWGIEALAAGEGLALRRTLVFDRALFPGYHNKKVLTKGSFPIWDARVYVFGSSSSSSGGESGGESPGAESEREDALRASFEATLPDMWDWSEGAWEVCPLLLPLTQQLLAGVEHRLRKKEHERLPPLPAATTHAVVAASAIRDVGARTGSIFDALADSDSSSSSDSDD